MKKYRYLVFVSFIVVFLVIFLNLFYKNNFKKEDYLYGAIYSSNNKSTISTYDLDGNNVSINKINFGGITLASFFKTGKEVGNNIYYASPLDNFGTNNYVLEINKNTLKAKEVKSSENITPTFFNVDENFLYAGVSSLESTYLSKTNILTNKVIKDITLEGQGILSIDDEENNYIISIIHNDTKNPYGKLSIVDKDKMQLKKTIDLSPMTFSTDAKIINNNMYILINRDEYDSLSNKILVVQLDNGEQNIIELPFNKINQLYTKGDYIYITEYDSREHIPGNKLCRVNIKTNEIDSFTLNNTPVDSKIYLDKFISSDGKKIYIYDLNNFNLLSEFKLNQVKGQEFVSLYIK